MMIRLFAIALLPFIMAIEECGKQDQLFVDAAEPCKHVVSADSPNGVEHYKLHLSSTTSLYFLKLIVGKEEIEATPDTGSSNLIFNAPPNLCKDCKEPFYTPSETSKNDARSFKVKYGSGSGTVAQYTDLLNFACQEHAIPVSFGLLQNNVNLPNILGLAYKSIAGPQQNPNPPVFDRMVSENKNVHDTFTMTLCGPRGGSTLVFGDIDSRIDRNDMNFVEIIEKRHYVIDARHMLVDGYVLDQRRWVERPGETFKVGDFPVSKSKAGMATVVDSATTLNILPKSMAKNIVSLMQSVNQQKGLKIPNDFWDANENDVARSRITLKEDTIRALPNFIVVVRKYKSDEMVYLKIRPESYMKLLGNKHIFSLRAPAKEIGFFILGEGAMESWAVEHDREHDRLGFASNENLCGG